MREDEMVDAFTTRVAMMENGIHGLEEKSEDISVVRRFLRAAPLRYMPIVSPSLKSQIILKQIK